MGIVAWITSGLLFLSAIAAEEAGQRRARPEPPVAPDEWTRAVEGKIGLWQVVSGAPKLVDGVIAFPPGRSVLCNEHSQRDFTLTLEWKCGGVGPKQAAVRFRSPEQEGVVTDPAFSLLENEAGKLIGDAAGRPQPVQPGDWNSLRLEVTGNKAQLKINDRVAFDLVGVTPDRGAVSIWAEVPEGGSFSIRNASLVESGYRSLFNGKDLAGWSGGGGQAEACWKVDAGLLQCTGAKGPWLKSDEEFGDFNLRLEYRLPPKGNSGVYVRVPADGNHHGKGSGVEIQVLDDAHKAYAQLQKYQYTGSVYAVAPATLHVARPAGEWNSLEINCRGQQYRVVHNGVVIVEADEGSFPALKERRLQGFFGLQNHSSVVSFRNLRLGPPQ